MRRVRVATVALLLLCLLLVQAPPSGAWNQVTHRQINLEALRLFMRQQAESLSPKYVWGPISPQGYDEPLRGIAVTSSSLLVDPWQAPDWPGMPSFARLERYQLGTATLTLPAWVSAGGDWADEPHLYASVRHFYDPLARWGHAYLTDQYEYHGWYDDPQIDARTWALSHPDNPFSWHEALSHYKAALEVDDEGWTPSPPVATDHFKTAIELTPQNADDERRIHLALAYRALGETMHLLGDMTQPAHVRNDSHPLDEPIEANTFSETVQKHAGKPVDAGIAPFLASAGGALQTPDELFRQVALFVNRSFYTADTIYDGEAMVIPANISIVDYVAGQKLPYDSPQFNDLTPTKASVNTWRGVVPVTRYYARLADVDVPMAQERLSWVWFGPQSPEMEIDTFTLRPYQVPPSFADQQAEVLMPIAIHAGADLIDLFYPTLRLTAEFEDQSEQEHGPSLINISAEMTHLVDEDIAWSEEGLSIAYTGPARLEMRHGDEAPVVRKLHFVQGQLTRIESYLGEMVEAPLVVYVAAPGTTMPEAEAFYRAEPGTQLQLIVEAGSRVFASDPYEIASQEPQVTIEGPRLVIFELRDGATETEQELSAYALPEGAYRYEWDFGDGATDSDEPRAGEPSVMSHTYRNLQAGDVIHPAVVLYGAEDEPLAEDSITIKVEGAQTETWDCGWPVDYSVLRRVEVSTAVKYLDADGNEHGPSLSWYDSSHQALHTACCYYQGSQHGRWVEWYENGVIKQEANLQYGVLEGMSSTYTPEGVKISEQEYHGGAQNGSYRAWYDNGTLRTEGQYTDDMTSGVWKSYSESGACDKVYDFDTWTALPCW